jgi:Protein of unknown function (DUF1501)
MLANRPSSRRGFLQRVGCSALSLSLADYFSRQAPGNERNGSARACLVLYCWGGMSHHETWDPKPDAPAEYRGEFRPIATAVSGVRIGEHLPLLARHTDKLAIIRSIHHRSSAHGKGMYWNWTGHAPLQAEVAVNQPPSRLDWPSLGAMVARFRPAPPGLPPAVQLPYPMVDNLTRQAGENAGWLGQGYDPVIVRPDRGRPYGGVSPDLGTLVLRPAEGVNPPRLAARQELAQVLDRSYTAPISRSFEQCCERASAMLTSPRVLSAFNLDHEPLALRQRYGEHICGQSVLLARRLLEAGVPIATVLCSAGDLNGSAGDHWDTHGNNFERLRRDLLPPFDRAVHALLSDLTERGRLAETLIVILTEFGRTPHVNRNAGRDHYPHCYSIALAGGGIRGGQVYGASDRIGALPSDQPCGPHDLHATIFHALGIPTDATLIDPLGRSFPITDGRILPLF